MSKKNRLLLLTVCLAFLLACNAVTRPLLNPAPTAEPLPTLEGDWRIKMVQTGGIMGLHHEMELTSDGTLTVSNPQSNQQNSLTITPEAMSKLKELVANSSYQPLQEPMGCADCFIFNLEISSGGETFQLEVDQVNAPATGLEPLIVFLRQMMEDGFTNPG
jgi:hypothetical protein